MCVGDGVCNLQQDFQILFNRLRLDHFVPWRSFHLLHGIERRSVCGLTEVMNRDDVRMNKVRSDQSFREKHLASMPSHLTHLDIREFLALLFTHGFECLDGELSIQRQLPRDINNSHPAFREFGHDFIICIRRITERTSTSHRTISDLQRTVEAETRTGAPNLGTQTTR